MPTGAASGEVAADDGTARTGADAAAAPDMARSGASRMKKSCDHCKTYMDHLDEKNQSMGCFLRHMTSSLKHVMIVPDRFLKPFVGKLSQTIKLESPNGSVYNVEVTERYNKMVLRHGWEEFVGDHHIEENDFLLFQHIENSVFKVLIFDSDGCEKIICCDCIKSIPSVGETRVDYVDISSSSQFDTIGSPGKLSSQHGKNLKMTATSSSSGGSGEDILSENECFESDDLEAPGADYIVPNRNYLSQEQKERVVFLIHEIQPETTVYVAVMQKSHVHPPAPSVDIIKEYAVAYFPHGNANVTLQTPGKSKKWHPKFNTTKSRLQGQWLDFVRDNHVQEGDICTFLPTPAKLGRRFTFTVYLIRAAASRSRSKTGFQMAGPCPGGGSSPKMAPEVHTKERMLSAGAYFIDMNGILHDSLESKDSGSPSHPLYFLPSKSGLSKSQKKIVEERVQAIKSEIPIYVAIMRRLSLGMSQKKSVLELGSRYATAVDLPTGEQTVVLMCGRNIWMASIVTYHQRQYLSGGWDKFVRDNGLDLGDICLFELKRNERELTMMVHIIPRKELSSRHGETLKMTVTSSSSRGSGEDIPSKNECFESDDLQAPGSDYIVSHRSYLSQEQNERVTLLIQEIQPKTAVYIAVMLKSHVHPPAPSVDIMKEYAFAYFPHGNTNVTLQRPGKSKKWHPKFNTTKSRLQGQWLDFVRDNDVQEGDICAFLPAPAKLGRRFTFTVYLLCAAASRSRSETGFQRTGPCPGGGSSPKTGSEVHAKEPTDGAYFIDMNGIFHESLESKDSGSPSHPLYFLPSSSGLSKSQKKIVEERVQAIKSEVPIYVAIMKRISLGMSRMSRIPKLELGSRYATAVNLPTGEQTVVLCCGRNIWKANIVTHRRRYYLSGGWHKFVRDNGLDLGDICLFELKRNERELTMMVHIIPSKEL